MNTEKIIRRIFFSVFRASFSVTVGRDGSDTMNVEVIGNVFDNADLLKESED